MGRPTAPNRTKKATQSDCVYTPIYTAKFIVNYFNPIGSILEPCAGENAFYNQFRNKEKYRCEISDGLDFFEWEKRVDWIITNPPYSIYDHFIEHCFNISDNVVLFVPIAKAFKSNKIEDMVVSYGGLKEIIYMGGGSRYGFNFGFPVGCLYYKKEYKGDCKITHYKPPKQKDNTEG